MESKKQDTSLKRWGSHYFKTNHKNFNIGFVHIPSSPPKKKTETNGLLPEIKLFLTFLRESHENCSKMNQGEVLIPSKDKLKIELYRKQKKWSFNIVTLPTSNSHSKWKPRSSEWKTLEYTRLVNSTFCVHWLASSEVIDKYYSPPNSQRYKIVTITEVKQFFGSYVVNNKTIIHLCNGK